MNYPEYVKVGDKQYKINTDFKVAIECNQIAMDETIGDFERALAVIYKLFGSEALNDLENYETLLDLAKKYLKCGKEVEEMQSSQEEPDMDYIQDMDYIEASFMSDYHIDLSNTKMHWWKFNKLMGGLSNSELGNCCILNRIRNLRNMDESKIEDAKERQRIHKAKKQFALNKKEVQLTDKQEKSMEELNRILGL